jgi:hypothetical protein
VVLKEAGMTPADVVSIQVYLTDEASDDWLINNIPRLMQVATKCPRQWKRN